MSSRLGPPPRGGERRIENPRPTVPTPCQDLTRWVRNGGRVKNRSFESNIPSNYSFSTRPTVVHSRKRERRSDWDPSVVYRITLPGEGGRGWTDVTGIDTRRW